MFHGEKLTYSPYGHAKLVNSCHDRVTYIEPRAIAAFQRDLPGCSHGDDQEVFVGGNQTWRRFLGAHARLKARESLSGNKLEVRFHRSNEQAREKHCLAPLVTGVIHVRKGWNIMYTRVIDSNQYVQGSILIAATFKLLNISFIYRELTCLSKRVVIYLLGLACLRSESAMSVDPMPLLVIIALDIGLYGNVTGMHAATSLVALSIDNFMD